jgi:hypothetical protein
MDVFGEGDGASLYTIEGNTYKQHIKSNVRPIHGETKDTRIVAFYHLK